MDLSRALRIRRHDLVGLVGAGGKTSAMFRLGDELAAQGWRILLTTSTRLGADQLALAPHVVHQPPDRPLTHSPTLLVGAVDPHTNKVAGLRPDLIDRLVSLPGVDVAIYEADGARTLPFKAPADHEPVLTTGTTLVVPVVGVDAVGQPLDADHVHRPERVAALSGAALDQPVTPQTVAAVLTHPQGGLKGVPPQARVVVLVNKVGTASQAASAQRLAELSLRCAQVDAVAIGAAQAAEPVRRVQSRVAAVVLAAGEGRRFGRSKQLEPWGEGTLLTHAVDTALSSRADLVVVVLGCRAEACRAALGMRLPAVRLVINPDWAQGQSTSMRAGLAALPKNVGAALFHLVDQPGITPAVMDALIARHASTLAPVVWPEYEGRRGNPVLFDRDAFPALRQVTGDVGGKPVLLSYARAGAAERVAVTERGILIDVDVPTDLSQIETDEKKP